MPKPTDAEFLAMSYGEDPTEEPTEDEGFFAPVAKFGRAVVPQWLRDAAGEGVQSILDTRTLLNRFDPIRGGKYTRPGYEDERPEGEPAGTALFGEPGESVKGDLAANLLSLGTFLPVAKVGLAARGLPRVAAGLTPRVATKALVAREAAIQTGATAAAVAAAKGLEATNLDESSLPDPIKFAAKLAVPLAAAVVGGKVSGSSIESLIPSLRRTTPLVQKVITASLPPGMQWKRPGTPTPLLPLNMSFEERAARIGTAPGLNDFPALARIADVTGVDPTAMLGADRSGRAFAAYQQHINAGRENARLAVDNAINRHGNIFGIKAGTPIGRLASGRLVDMNDVLEHPEKFGLNTRELDVVQDAQRVQWEMIEKMRLYGVEHADKLEIGKAHRKVIGFTKGDIHFENLRHTNPLKARQVEFQSQGAASGIDYDNFVSATKEFLEWGESEIALKQFSDYLAGELPGSMSTRSIGIEDVIARNHPKLKVQKDNAIAAVKNLNARLGTAITEESRLASAISMANKALKEGLTVPGEGPTEIVSIFNKYGWRHLDPINNNAVLHEMSRDYLQAKFLKDRLGQQVAAATKKSDLFRGKWSRAKKTATERSWVNGDLFGYTSLDKVPVATFRNRFFLRTVNVGGQVVERSSIDDILKWVDGISGNIKPATGVASVVSDAVNVFRSGSATGDMAAPFISGLPTLGMYPEVWAKAVVLHYKALLDPAAIAKYGADPQHAATRARFAQHNVMFGESEMFETARAAGPISGAVRGTLGLASRIPVVGRGVTGVRHAYQGFQRAYEQFNSVLRTELLETLDGTMADEELARFVNRMTGGITPRNIGATPTRAALEGLWMAFSPRLLRSTTALLGSAASGRGQASQAALLALTRLAGVATGMFILTAHASGMSEADIQVGLNPTSGRKYMSIPVEGNWIGPSGIMRSLTQTVATLAVDLTSKDETRENADGNPLLKIYDAASRAYVNRAAPGVTFGQAFLETAAAMSGGSLDAAPFESLTGPLDLINYVGKSHLPFTVQSVLEQGTLRPDKRVIGGPLPIDTTGLAAVVPQFIGGRATPFSIADFRDEKARELDPEKYTPAEQAVAAGGRVRSFKELTGQHQQEIEEEHADTLKALRAHASPTSQTYEAEKNRITTETYEREEGLARALASKNIDLAAFRDAVSASEQERVVALKAVQRALGIKFPPDTDNVITQFFSMREEVVRSMGFYDPQAVDTAQEEFLAGLTTEQRDLIDSRRTFKHSPVIQFYFDAKREIADAGYWDAQADALRPYVSRIRTLTGEEGTYTNLIAAIPTATPARQAALKSIQRLIDKAVEAKRLRLRARSKPLETALTQVYGTVPLNRQKR